MDEDKVSSVLSAMQRARPFDLFLLSFLLLPFIFDKWVDILTKASVGKVCMELSLAAVLIAYLVCVIALVYKTHKRRKAEVARDQIIGYLQSKGFTLMSFERIREKVHQGYSDTYLESVVQEFPVTLRFARLKGGKRGLGRIVEESTEDES